MSSANNAPDTRFGEGYALRVKHDGITCDGPSCPSRHQGEFLMGPRYTCLKCANVDFCHACVSDHHEETRHPLGVALSIARTSGRNFLGSLQMSAASASHAGDTCHECHRAFQVGDKSYLFTSRDTLRNNGTEQEAMCAACFENFITSPNQEYTELHPELKKRGRYRYPSFVLVNTIPTGAFDPLTVFDMTCGMAQCPSSKHRYGDPVAPPYSTDGTQHFLVLHLNDMRTSSHASGFTHPEPRPICNACEERLTLALSPSITEPHSVVILPGPVYDDQHLTEFKKAWINVNERKMTPNARTAKCSHCLKSMSSAFGALDAHTTLPGSHVDPLSYVFYQCMTCPDSVICRPCYNTKVEGRYDHWLHNRGAEHVYVKIIPHRIDTLQKFWTADPPHIVVHGQPSPAAPVSTSATPQRQQQQQYGATPTTTSYGAVSTGAPPTSYGATPTPTSYGTVSTGGAPTAYGTSSTAYAAASDATPGITSYAAEAGGGGGYTPTAATATSYAAVSEPAAAAGTTTTTTAMMTSYAQVNDIDGDGVPSMSYASAADAPSPYASVTSYTTAATNYGTVPTPDYHAPVTNYGSVPDQLQQPSPSSSNYTAFSAIEPVTSANDGNNNKNNNASASVCTPPHDSVSMYSAIPLQEDATTPSSTNYSSPFLEDDDKNAKSSKGSSLSSSSSSSFNYAPISSSMYAAAFSVVDEGWENTGLPTTATGTNYTAMTDYTPSSSNTPYTPVDDVNISSSSSTDGHPHPSPSATAPSSVEPSNSSTTTRNWTFELQQIIEDYTTNAPNQPANDSGVFDQSEAQINKLGKLLSLSLAFEQIAKKHARTIIEEMDLEDEDLRTIPALSVGGVAGGEKYLVDGIFFKFATDVHGIYGGDEFAMKAGSHELRGMQAYLAFLAHHVTILPNEPLPLNIPLMLLIDYRGYRIIATSALPIGGSTLKYGSADGGRSVHKDVKNLNRTMKAAGQFINLKGHMVGVAAQKKLFAPCDIEGHEGKDGKYYVLDTARVFPPETVSKTFMAVQIHPETYGSNSEGSATRFFTDMIESSIAINTWERTVQRLLGSDKFEEYTMPGAKLYATATGTLNLRASMLAQARIQGTAVVVPDGVKGKQLYNLLRPELVRGHSMPLSPDAFTGFGRHNFQEHNREVRELTQLMVTKHIPSLVKDINEGRILITSTLELSKILHERGVNTRYLAVVRSKVESQMMKGVIMVDMVSRVVKNFVRHLMRKTSNENQLKVLIVHYLNLIFLPFPNMFENDPPRVRSQGLPREIYPEPSPEYMASLLYWSSIKVGIQSKFGVYGTAFPLRDRPFMALLNDICTSFDIFFAEKNYRPLLFASLQRQLGIKLATTREYVFEHGSFVPFSVQDIIGVEVKIEGRLDILKFVQELQNLSTMRPTMLESLQLTSLDEIFIQQKLVQLEHYQATLLPYIGEHKYFANLINMQIAYAHLLLNHIDIALDIVQRIVETQEEVPAMLTSIIYFLLGINADQLKENEKSVYYYAVSHECLRIYSGSERNVGHPFDLLIIAKLTDALRRVGITQRAKNLSVVFFNIIKELKFPFHFSAFSTVLGAGTPFPLAMYFENYEYFDYTANDPFKELKWQTSQESDISGRIANWRRIVNTHLDIDTHLNIGTLNPALDIFRVNLGNVVAVAINQIGQRDPEIPRNILVSPDIEDCIIVYQFQKRDLFPGFKRYTLVDSIRTGGARGSGGGRTLARISSIAVNSNWYSAQYAYSMCALTPEGDLYGLGNGDNGELGLGVSTTVQEPTYATHVGNLKKVSLSWAENSHFVGLSTSGEVYTVGAGRNGQIGHGVLENSVIPRVVTGLVGEDIVDVAAGSLFSMAVSSAAHGEKVFYWGMAPTFEHNLAEPRLATALSGKGIVKIEGGRDQAFFLTKYGTVYCIGKVPGGKRENNYDPEAPRLSKPTLIDMWAEQRHLIVDVKSAITHVLALTTEGVMLTFGTSQGGALGTKTAWSVYSITKHAPVLTEDPIPNSEFLRKLHEKRATAIRDGASRATEGTHEPLCYRMAFFDGKRALRIAVARAVSACILEDGSVWTWGSGVMVPREVVPGFELMKVNNRNDARVYDYEGIINEGQPLRLGRYATDIGVTTSGILVSYSNTPAQPHPPPTDPFNDPNFQLKPYTPPAATQQGAGDNGGGGENAATSTSYGAFDDPNNINNNSNNNSNANNLSLPVAPGPPPPPPKPKIMKVEVVQEVQNSWIDPTTKKISSYVKVLFNNVGEDAIHHMIVKIKGSTPSKMWSMTEVDATVSRDLCLTLPEYLQNSGIQPGATHEWGYFSHKTTALPIIVLEPAALATADDCPDEIEEVPVDFGARNDVMEVEQSIMSMYNDPNNNNAQTVYIKVTLKNKGVVPLSHIKIKIHGRPTQMYSMTEYTSPDISATEEMVLVLPGHVGNNGTLSNGMTHDFYYMATNTSDPLQISIVHVDTPETAASAVAAAAALKPARTSGIDIDQVIMSQYNDPNNNNVPTVYVKGMIKNPGLDHCPVKLKLDGRPTQLYSMAELTDVPEASQNVTILTLPSHVGNNGNLPGGMSHDFFYMATNRTNPLDISVIEDNKLVEDPSSSSNTTPTPIVLSTGGVLTGGLTITGGASLTVGPGGGLIITSSSSPTQQQQDTTTAPSSSTPSSSSSSSSPVFAPQDWNEFFGKTGLASDIATNYIKLFDENGIDLRDISELSHDILKELDVKVGHRMAIMKARKEMGHA